MSDLNTNSNENSIDKPNINHLGGNANQTKSMAKMSISQLNSGTSNLRSIKSLNQTTNMISKNSGGKEDKTMMSSELSETSFEIHLK